jgi:histone H3/H4
MQNLLNPVVPSPAAPESAVTETPSTNDNVTVITTDNETTDVGLHLPMSRIKKIIKLDPEHISSTESANYVLGVATELFIKQLTLDSSTITKNKGRKKITYDDMHHVVSSADIYSFMRDIVPKRAAIGELMSKGIIKLRPADEQRMRSGLEKFGYVEGGEGPGDQLAEDVDLEGDVEVEVEEIGVEDGAHETEKGRDVARDDETIDDDGMDVDIDTDAETEAETGVQTPFGAVENTVDNETVDEDEDGEEEDVDDNRDEVKAGAEAST